MEEKTGWQFEGERGESLRKGVDVRRALKKMEEERRMIFEWKYEKKGVGEEESGGGVWMLV